MSSLILQTNSLPYVRIDLHNIVFHFTVFLNVPLFSVEVQFSKNSSGSPLLRKEVKTTVG